MTSYRECAVKGCSERAAATVHGCSAEFRGRSIQVDECAEHARMAQTSDLVERVEWFTRETSECSACGGDGEVGVPPLAWCLKCRGTGLADNECAGCGEPTTLSTLDHAPLDCIGVVVHASCDTGSSFFDNRPKPVLHGAT